MWLQLCEIFHLYNQLLMHLAWGYLCEEGASFREEDGFYGPDPRALLPVLHR